MLGTEFSCKFLIYIKPTYELDIAVGYTQGRPEHGEILENYSYFILCYDQQKHNYDYL